MTKTPAKTTKKKGKKEYVTIYTPVGILSYPYLVEPDTGRENSSNKYSAELFVPKPVWEKEGKDVEEGILKVARKYFDDDAMELDDFKGPLTDMDEVKKKEDWQAGMIRIRAKAGADYKPTVIGPRRDENNKFPVLSDDFVSKIKGGDFVRLICAVYGYPQQGGGIALGLNFVQFAKEGKALGQGRMKQVENLGEIEVEVDSPDDMMDTEETAAQDFA